MNIEIQAVKKPIEATIIVPGSRSMTHRALLLAALADGTSNLSGMLISEDTNAFITALQELGVSIQFNELKRSCTIEGCNGQFPEKSASIWCASAGTLARFLLAACAISPGKYYFDANPDLKDRPMEPLMRVLSSQGAKFDPSDAKQMPFIIKGVEGIAGDEMEIPNIERGQFLSALLMISPFAKSLVEIKSEDTVDRPYVDMTCKMMADFGVLVRRLHQSRFLIPVPQRYRAENYKIEADFLTSFYFFAAAGVTGGQITIQPFDRENSIQADVKFLGKLEKMGCEIISDIKSFTVKGPNELLGINLDMRDYSDTFTALMAMAPFAKTPTTITNFGHTSEQETQRIETMRASLEKMQVKIETGADWLRIFPSEPRGIEIDSHLDHRIAMAFAIIGLRVPGVKINGSESVAKTCPEFFDLWHQLGSFSCANS